MPAAELERGFPLDADQVEAVALVETKGRDVPGVDAREHRVVPEHLGAPDQLGKDQAPEACAALVPLDVDGILDRSSEGTLGLVGRQRAVGQHVLAGHGDDRGMALAVPGQPLALGGFVPGLGVGGRVGAEDLVVPDRGDLLEIGLARVANRDPCAASARRA